MGTRRPDVLFHLETGLTERIGVHVRNDQFRSKPRTGVMFRFLALQSRDGISRIMAPGVRLLGGLTMPLTGHILAELTVQVPLTTRRDVGSHLVFGPAFD